jgi:hypothetical protein
MDIRWQVIDVGGLLRLQPKLFDCRLKDPPLRLRALCPKRINAIRKVLQYVKISHQIRQM